MEGISKEPDGISCLAVQTRDVRHKALNAGRYVSRLDKYLNSLRAIPGVVNTLEHYVDINPDIDIAGIDQQTPISFVGMEDIESDVTGEYTATDRMLHEVGSGYTRFMNGDILWARLDQSMQSGKSCIVDNLTNGIGFGSTEFHVLRVRDASLSPKFLLDLLGQKTFLHMAGYSFTGSSRQRVPPEFLQNLPIPVPSEKQQDEIVRKMDAARVQQRAKNEEANMLLSGMDNFILNTLGITPPAEDDRRIFAARREFLKHRLDCHFYTPRLVQIEFMLSQVQNATLGELVSFSQETWNPENEESAKFRYIEISSVCRKTGLASWREIPTNEAPSRARMKTRKNDIIVSLTRPHHGSIAHLDTKFEGCVASTGFAVIRDVAPQVSREYLWLILRTWFSLRQMLRHASGGNYPAITQSELEKIIIPMPDRKTQAFIVAEVRRQHIQAMKLRDEAQAIWRDARRWFEEQFWKR